MEILKHKKENNQYVEKYKLNCSCGCEFVCDWNENEAIEKSLQNAKMWFKCPECSKTLVITRMDYHLIEYCNQ